MAASQKLRVRIRQVQTTHGAQYLCPCLLATSRSERAWAPVDHATTDVQRQLPGLSWYQAEEGSGRSHADMTAHSSGLLTLQQAKRHLHGDNGAMPCRSTGTLKVSCTLSMPCLPIGVEMHLMDTTDAQGYRAAAPERASRVSRLRPHLHAALGLSRSDVPSVDAEGTVGITQKDLRG